MESKSMTRIVQIVARWLIVLVFGSVTFGDERPNILFCLADDWGWPHANAYGDPVVKTPVFDRLAKEGLLFENAFVVAPSCTPCRNAILTGQYHFNVVHDAG
jgi:N-sulfoglucosamine sulfohydrolase